VLVRRGDLNVVCDVIVVNMPFRVMLDDDFQRITKEVDLRMALTHDFEHDWHVNAGSELLR